MATVIAYDYVSRNEVAEDPNSVGLLTKICMGGSKKPASRKFGQHSLLETPDSEHSPI
jgi:hypothetical protein